MATVSPAHRIEKMNLCAVPKTGLTQAILRAAEQAEAHDRRTHKGSPASVAGTSNKLKLNVLLFII